MNPVEFAQLRLSVQERTVGGLLLLIVAGFLGNYFRWTLFFDIDFLFGSIAVWIIVCLYGVSWGTIAALMAGSYTYILWHHPYAIVIFTAEAFFVGWLFHRQPQHNIVLLDAVFWWLIGMPLVWFFYAILLHVEPTQVYIILLKQPVNGIFNALIASLLLTHFPIHRWVARPMAIGTLSLQQTLFNLFVAFVSVPTLMLIVLASHQAVKDITTSAQISLSDTSRYLTTEVQLWYDRRLRAVTELANVAATETQTQAVVQQNITFAQRTFLDFQHIHVLDEQGTPLLQWESDRQDGETSHHELVNEAEYFGIIRRLGRPFLSNVLPASQHLPFPTIVLGVPMMQNGAVAGAVLAEIDFSRVNALLASKIGSHELDITLMDALNTVAASTQPDWIGRQNFDWRQDGTVEAIGAQTYHWLPNTGISPAMVRWGRSFFVKESVIRDDIPWSLVIKMSSTPHVRRIEKVHTRNMAILLLVSGLALIFAMLISHRLVKPLAQLTDVTTNLPNKLLEDEPVHWNHSQITEFALLGQNFRLMAVILQQKFREIQQANETLEQRVQERTQALRQTNAELEVEIRERQQVETALRESEARFRLLAENTNDLVCLHHPNGEYLYISPSCESLLGYGYEELLGQDPYSFFHPDDRDRIWQEAHLGVLSGNPAPITYRMRRKLGDYIWLETLTRAITDANGQVIRLQTTSRDVTDRVQAQKQLRHEALHDALTGLPNRNLLTERLDLALKRRKRCSEFQFAVLFLDLDQFKVINDSLGHLAGDQLLVTIAAQLQGVVRDMDLAARLGGDEFVVLLEDITGVEEAIRVAERIAENLRMPFKLDDREVFITPSIGIVIGSMEHRQASDLLRDADLAMYRAKANGRARYELFDPMMHLQALKRLHLENDLRKALEKNEFFLHYQPIVSLETGAIVGCEVLLRWQHPLRGFISPAEFIPVAEETGMIVPIGRWVLEQACWQLSAWQHQIAIARDLKLSVNLSARQFREVTLTQQIEQILLSTAIEGENLVLELTESVLVENMEQVIAVLSQLRSHGIQISIDDFGTGYSSLSYLHQFPLNNLKIDRSFINRIGTAGEQSEMAEIILTIARQLGLEVTAEGIETRTQCEQLRRLGCKLGQGYLFAAPLSAEQFTILLDQSWRYEF